MELLVLVHVAVNFINYIQHFFFFARVSENRIAVNIGNEHVMRMEIVLCRMID
jgi:hypothetical protein